MKVEERCEEGCLRACFVGFEMKKSKWVLFIEVRIVFRFFENFAGCTGTRKNVVPIQVIGLSNGSVSDQVVPIPRKRVYQYKYGNF